MGFFRKFFDDYSDEGSDTESYDETNQITNPSDPTWEGSEIHTDPYGTDPTLPDPNEINQD